MDTSHPHPQLPQQNITPLSLNDLHLDETYSIIVVRALFPYHANDTTTISLSFAKDDLIQVVAQLESGWWYGFCNNAQGWFPSNFVEEISQADLDDSDSQEEETSIDDWWLPQTTVDGQVYYFNTRTRETSLTIPTPASPKATSITSSVASLSLSSTSASTSVPASASASTSASASASASTSNNTPLSTSTSNLATPSLPNHHQRSDSFIINGNITSTTTQRNISPDSSRSSLAGASVEKLEQSPESTRAQASFIQENEAEGPDVTRPNSWQASAIPTRSGSPTSQEGSHSQLAGIRKPSNSVVSAASLEQCEGLPPLPPMTNPFESGPTWNSLSEHISVSIRNLVHSATHGYKGYYQIQAAQVVESVRVMLYSSGTIDKDADAIRQNLDLKIYHRQVMAALSRLVLSAKMASSLWPAEGAIAKMRSNADDVANAVQQFISIAQSAGVTVNDVDAKLILDPEGSSEPKNSFKLGRSLSVTARPSVDLPDRSSYRHSLGSVGLIAQLDYYGKSACKAMKLLTLQINKVLENPYLGPPRSSQLGPRPPAGTIMSSAQSSQLVKQCQQTISQIGSLLSLVTEYYSKVLADHPKIKDHIFLDIRVSKQALYNNVASLVMAIQLATDPMAQVTVLEMTLEAIQTAESSVMDLTDAARSLAAENDEAEKQTRSRQNSDSSSVTIDAGGYRGSQRQSGIDGFFMDLDSELDGDSLKSSQRRESRVSSFSSNSSFSAVTAPTTPGSEYTGRSYSTAYSFSQLPSMSPIEITPPTSNRPSITLTQKVDNRSAKLKKMLGDDVPTPKPVKVVEVPWYLGHDYSPSDISFNMEGHVKGGTLSALVERLTLHDGLDPNFVATFLLTYRSFTTTTELFSLLFRRIAISPPPGLNSSELAIWVDRKLTPIRLRVFNIIKTWLENYYLEDEVEDRQILPRIKSFAESTQMRELMSFAVVQLIKLVEKREASDGSFRKMVLNLSTQAPPPITPRNLKRIKFMDLDPLEFARQLTIMESNNYNKIKPVECLAKAWTSDDPTLAANIRKMIETSNLYANWINEIILTEPEVRKRVLIIKQLISIAEKLRQLNNFSMLSATTAALAQSPIHRLKRTWELVPSKTLNTFSVLQAVTSSAKSWGDYRQELHSANPPCVPFIGIYLTDMVFIQDGNPDILKGTDHINFYKRVSTAEVIREIQQYQSVPYCLTAVNEIQNFIRRGMERSKSVTDLHEMSLALEPREGDEEKITRLLGESGFL